MPEEEGAEDAEEPMTAGIRSSKSTTRMEEGDGTAAPPSIPHAPVAPKSRKRPRPPAHEWGLDPLFWVRV